MRSSLVAVVALVSAFLGGTGALLVGKAAGWIDGETVVRSAVVEEAPSEAIPSSATPTPSDETARPLPGNDFDPSAIYEARAAGVVTVISLFGDEPEEGGVRPRQQGSGFVVSRDGYVLTNAHVITTAGDGTDNVEPATEVFLEFPDGDRAAAEIVGYDLFDDVGLLKLDPRDHEVRPLPLGDSNDVVVGEPVAAIGSPFDQASTLTVGVVGATERSVDSLTSGYSLVDAIQTDAPINPGNSGGPLLDARGRVIGINAQIRSSTGTAEGVGFAVPINSAVRSMEQLIESGRVRYAWVGLVTQTVTPGLARSLDLPVRYGAAVQDVIEDSPAEEAGLRAGDRQEELNDVQICVGGDVIVAIDGRPIRTSEDVVRAVTRKLPGDTARITVVRDDERQVVDVVLGERRPAATPDDDQPCS